MLSYIYDKPSSESNKTMYFTMGLQVKSEPTRMNTRQQQLVINFEMKVFICNLLIIFA